MDLHQLCYELLATFFLFHPGFPCNLDAEIDAHNPQLCHDPHFCTWVIILAYRHDLLPKQRWDGWTGETVWERNMNIDPRDRYIHKMSDMRYYNDLAKIRARAQGKDWAKFPALPPA